MEQGDSGLAKESAIHGTTLRVYWYLFKASEPVGVRETQRALALSSPSIALYHLEKLRELGVVDKTPSGAYALKEQVQIGSLKAFLKVGPLILPRYLFYAVFLSTAVIVYSAVALFQSATVNPAAIILGATGAGISWYECGRMWKDRAL